MNRSTLKQLAAVAALLVVLVGTAIAHVTVSPKESTVSASEKYTFRVPTEKTVPTTQVEIAFPVGVTVTSLEPTAGWKIESKKDAAGKIIGAVWSGSTIAPRASAEFSIVVKNPGDESTLVWKVVQIYQDGSKSEWTEAAGGRSPAPVTALKKAAGGK